mmetsp:Transcript_42147/g.107769  ORF Transcript_42147/g.107769 Transcript_42147/m.107769 type:complete len:139 (+) Transcript_42147:821-1237(+)
MRRVATASVAVALPRPLLWSLLDGRELPSSATSERRHGCRLPSQNQLRCSAPVKLAWSARHSPSLPAPPMSAARCPLECAPLQLACWLLALRQCSALAPRIGAPGLAPRLLQATAGDPARALAETAHMAVAAIQKKKA